MKVKIVSCVFITVLFCITVPSVTKAGPTIETGHTSPTELKVVEITGLSLPSSFDGRPEIKAPLSEPVLLHYQKQYIPAVIDLEYQDTLMQRLGIEDPDPQVLSIWASDFIVISAVATVGKASSSYIHQNISNLELKIVDKTFTLESNYSLYVNAYFKTFVFSKEVKEALKSASPEQISLRIQVDSSNDGLTFINTPIGEKTIKAWQSLSN